jgi:hypothetical protein
MLTPGQKVPFEAECDGFGASSFSPDLSLSGFSLFRQLNCSERTTILERRGNVKKRNDSANMYRKTVSENASKRFANEQWQK